MSINDMISILEDYPKIQKLQNHLYQKMNKEEAHNIIWDKLKKHRQEKSYYQDIMKWIYLVFAHDAVWQYFRRGIYRKKVEKQKELNELRTQSLNYIEKLNKNMFFTTEQNLQPRIKEILTELQEMNTLKHEDFETFDTMKEFNYLLNNKIRDNFNGLKITSLRYIYIILLVTLQHEKPKGLYNLALYILQDIYQGFFTADELSIESVHKYLKDIDIMNKDQVYLTSFFIMYKTLDEKEQFETLHQNTVEMFNNPKEFEPNFVYGKDKYDFVHTAKNSLDKKNCDIEFDLNKYYDEWKENSIVYDLYIQFIQFQFIKAHQNDSLKQYF